MKKKSRGRQMSLSAEVTSDERATTNALKAPQCILKWNCIINEDTSVYLSFILGKYRKPTEVVSKSR